MTAILAEAKGAKAVGLKLTTIEGDRARLRDRPSQEFVGLYLRTPWPLRRSARSRRGHALPATAPSLFRPHDGRRSAAPECDRCEPGPCHQRDFARPGPPPALDTESRRQETSTHPTALPRRRDRHLVPWLTARIPNRRDTRARPPAVARSTSHSSQRGI